MKIFIYSTYLFLLQPPFLPTKPPSNQLHGFWKSKVKHTGVDITCSEMPTFRNQMRVKNELSFAE